MRGTFGFPLFKAIDGNGNPIRGGKLYTYSVGTSNNKATYSDYALTVAHANPVVLNSDGQALIYLSGSYRMNLTTSADGQVPGWPVDNIIGDISTDLIFLKEHIATGLHFAPDARSYTGGTFAAAVTAIGATETTLVISQSQAVTANVTIPSTLTLRFREGGKLNISNGVVVTLNGPVEAPMAQIFTGAGTVVFNRNAKELSPQWWGALGDNSADDTAEFTAAKAAFVAGGTLALPNGTYMLGNWVHGTSGVILRGAGSGYTEAASATVLKALGTLGGTDYVVKVPLYVGDNAVNGVLYKAHIKDLMINGNGVARGLLLHGTGSRVENVVFLGCVNYSVFMDDAVVDSLDDGGLFGCAFRERGIQIAGGSLNVRDGYFYGNGATTAIDISQGNRISIENSLFESWFRPVIYAEPSAGKNIMQLSIENNRIWEGTGGGAPVLDFVSTGITENVHGLIIRGNQFVTQDGLATNWIRIGEAAEGPITIKENRAQAVKPIVLQIGDFNADADFDVGHNENMDVDITYSRGTVGNMVASASKSGWRDVRISHAGADRFQTSSFKGRRIATTDATMTAAFAFPTEATSAGHWQAKVLAYNTTDGLVNIYQVNARSITTTVVGGATVTDLQTVVSEGDAAAVCQWAINGVETEIVELQLTGIAAKNYTWIVDVDYEYYKFV